MLSRFDKWLESDPWNAYLAIHLGICAMIGLVFLLLSLLWSLL